MIVTHVIIGIASVKKKKKISFKKLSMNRIIQSPFVVYKVDSKRERSVNRFGGHFDSNLLHIYIEKKLRMINQQVDCFFCAKLITIETPS